MRFLFLMLLPILGHAQLAVRIVDSATGRGLPYATIATVDGKWGRVSDSAGLVLVPDSLSGQAMQASFVRYDARPFVLRAAVAIGLSQKALPEVVVRACSRDAVKRLGWTKRTGNYGYGWGDAQQGYLWATFIPNDQHREGRLETLHFIVEDRRQARLDAPIRVHIYAATDSPGKRGAELTYSDIRVAPGRSGHIAVDLSNEAIQIPADGVFVAFEFFDDTKRYAFGEEYSDRQGNRATAKNYGFWVRAMPRGYGRGYAGRSWSHWMGRVGDGPAIGLDVRYCFD